MESWGPVGKCVESREEGGTLARQDVGGQDAMPGDTSRIAAAIEENV